MRFLLSLVVLSGVIAAIGCASDSGTAPRQVAQSTAPPVGTSVPTPASTAIPTLTPGPSREALLREFALTWGNAFAIRDWASVHSTYSDDFRSKCPVSEFAEWVAFLNDNAIGVPEGATYVLDSVMIEGDYGWVNSYFVKDGRQIFHDEDQNMANEPAEAVWRNSKWGTITSPELLAQEQPCSLERYFGFFINLPLPAGSTIQEAKGRIDVTGVVTNATQIVLQENQFNDSPKPGNHFYIVAVEAEYFTSGIDYISITHYDFKLIGDKRKLYDPIDDGCGVFPNSLDAELYPGGTDQGNVCFEVSDNDSGFILIFDAGTTDQRRFLSLE